VLINDFKDVSTVYLYITCRYTGLLCNQKVNYCASKPCANYGTCVSSDSGYTCDCPPGFKGSNCEIDVCNLPSVCL